MFRLSFMFIALLTAGCVSLDPHYDRPAAPVPVTLPGAHGESTAVVGDWQKVVNDARLKKWSASRLTATAMCKRRWPISRPRAPSMAKRGHRCFPPLMPN